MAHRVLLSLLVLVALTMIGVSLVWPRGSDHAPQASFGREAGDIPGASR